MAVITTKSGRLDSITRTLSHNWFVILWTDDMTPNLDTEHGDLTAPTAGWYDPEEVSWNTIEWDEDTRKVIEKDQADEDGHINKWKKFLSEQ